MCRELLLWMLSLLLVGSLNVAFGIWLGAGPGRAAVLEAAGAMDAERAAWWGLWRPLLPGGLVLAFLLGWALQEPESAEALHSWAYLCAAPVAVVWTRASVRAWRSGSATRVALAGTVGLLRPRVVISPELRAALDEAALQAAVEHERAHARHRDPLRLWLAQLATDLQWPARSAPVRLAHWREVLELARDEEACARGAAGPDLAAAVVTAARLQRQERPLAAIAGLGAAPRRGPRIARSADEVLRVRIARLLDGPRAAVRARRHGALLGGAIIAGIVFMVLVGYRYGEAVVVRIAEL